MKCLDGITDSMDMSLSKLLGAGKEEGSLASAVHGVAKTQSWLSDWTELNWKETLLTTQHSCISNLKKCKLMILFARFYRSFHILHKITIHALMFWLSFFFHLVLLDTISFSPDYMYFFLPSFKMEIGIYFQLCHEPLPKRPEVDGPRNRQTELSQTEKERRGMTSLICGNLKSNDTNELTKQKETHRLREGTYGHLYTLLYLKWINKDLLYITVNSAQCYVAVSLDGRGVLGRVDTCIWVAQSLHCPPEIITTWKISSTPI